MVRFETGSLTPIHWLGIAPVFANYRRSSLYLLGIPFVGGARSSSDP